jgi:hypothetical protein
VVWLSRTSAASSARRDVTASHHFLCPADFFDAAVKEHGMWGKRVVCGEAGTGLGRQGRGRVWLCSGGAAKARYALHGLTETAGKGLLQRKGG